MQFGLFGGARTKRSAGIEDSQGYESFIDYVVEADRLGFMATLICSTSLAVPFAYMKPCNHRAQEGSCPVRAWPVCGGI